MKREPPAVRKRTPPWRTEAPERYPWWLQLLAAAFLVACLALVFLAA